MNALNYITIATFIFGISALSAQDRSSVFGDNSNKFQIGIKAGGNSSNLYDMKAQKFAGASIWAVADAQYRIESQKSGFWSLAGIILFLPLNNQFL